jgi:mRNA interferase MazF
VVRFVKGKVFVLPFPFSDLSSNKKRPALVVTQLRGDDVILCQITSQSKSDGYSIPLTNDDFSSGRLKIDSNIRPNRLFTADSNIISYSIGTVGSDKLGEVIDKIIDIVQAK